MRNIVDTGPEGNYYRIGRVPRIGEIAWDGRDLRRVRRVLSKSMVVHLESSVHDLEHAARVGGIHKGVETHWMHLIPVDRP